jgi:hypothetical protein
VLVEKYDGSCRAADVELNRIHAWIRIHNIPELYRKKHLITGLAKSIGQVIGVGMNGVGPDCGDFVRARVWLDVHKCLTRFVSFNPEEGRQVIMRVKYEKLPRYCAVCGLLGHVQEECGSGEHAPEAVAFGKWLLADTPWNRVQLYGGQQSRPMGWERQSERKDVPGAERAGRGRGRGWAGGGGVQGRGGGRGLGENSLVEIRKRTSTEARLESLAKELKGGEKQNPPLQLQWRETGIIATDPAEGLVKKKLEFGERESGPKYPPRSGTPPPPPSAREQKRPKKKSTPKKDKVSEAAASGAEDRQAQ